MNVAIDEPYRRRGLAHAHARAAVRGHLRRRHARLHAGGAGLNHGAIRLYERLGFQPTGIRRGYYTDNREDALIMWKDGPEEL